MLECIHIYFELFASYLRDIRVYTYVLSLPRSRGGILVYFNNFPQQFWR